MEFEPGLASERLIEYLPTKEGYDRWAAIYDAEENPLILLEEMHLPPLLGDVRDLAIADLGGGTGRHAVRLAAAGARVTALDFSDVMMARARGKPGGERVGFIAYDLTRRLRAKPARCEVSRLAAAASDEAASVSGRSAAKVLGMS